MALATKCPHCNTTFRVAADQLKLRGGIVRCGTCSQVFDGNAALIDLAAVAKNVPAPVEPIVAAAPDVSVEEPVQQAEPEPVPEPEPEPVLEPEAEPEPEPAPSASAAFDNEVAAIEAKRDAPEPGYVLDFDMSLDTFPEQESDRSAVDDAPEPEPTPLPADEFDSELPPGADSYVVEEEETSEPVPSERDVDIGPLPLLRASAPTDEPAELPVEPAPPVYVEPEPDEPDFVRLAREQEEAAQRRTIIMGIGSFLLLLALLVQGIMSFGNVIVAKYPAFKPTLVSACALLRCKIELPTQIDGLSIETSELQTLPNGNFMLTTLLRNESALTQAWPHIELELKDANDKPQVRRVFTPAQYLPPNVTPGKGFAARSEQPIKIYFELKQVKASGFHTEIFYP